MKRRTKIMNQIKVVNQVKSHFKSVRRTRKMKASL